MSIQLAKRQRANTNGDLTVASTPTDTELDRNARIDYYKSIIDTFGEVTVREVLLATAQYYPDVAALIVRKRDSIPQGGKRQSHRLRLSKQSCMACTQQPKR